ncbi:uncharacterized protein LOC129775519 isoform X2 [Toxorhynchites rutilus septentrionalis]|uniref:uncharacterized protein LOC129775519 isoform X2 n=1 Tax=Toxorhynchites rutilus septentrionalis TaxID=329112 RepID=UPI002479DAF2|nr:uncharacterized protein LOC129775519 isoform X2 [Toxorhynchites rutilus septentrionalis]
MNDKSIVTEKIKWLHSENGRVIDEIKLYKKKQEELELKIKELFNYLNNRGNQLETIKKHCEETKLQITEVTSNEKRILAIHELEKSRYSKLRRAVNEHKEAFSRAIRKQRINSCQVNSKTHSPVVPFPNQVSYVNYSLECQLDERKRYLDNVKPRIIRLRKLLQSNEAKRALCKEQLTALKSKQNRRY